MFRRISFLNKRGFLPIKDNFKDETIGLVGIARVINQIKSQASTTKDQIKGDLREQFTVLHESLKAFENFLASTPDEPFKEVVNKIALVNKLIDDNNDYFDLGNARDIVGVAVKNGVEYYASWYNGIPCRSNVSGYIDRYGYLNTNGALDTVYYSNNRIRISDIKFDDYGNLWGLSSEVNHPLFVKTSENTWHSYSMNQDVVDLFFDELLSLE